MEVKTKKVIQSVTFTENEKDFMNYLADTMEEECGNHSTCETCPFADHGYEACENFIETLRLFASEGQLEVF